MRVSRRTVCSAIAILAAIWLAQAVLAQDGSAAAPPTTDESFGGAFFISRVVHADGTQSIDPVGTALIWVLLSLSILSTGLIGYLALTNQRRSIVPSGIVNEARRLLQSGDYGHAMQLLQAEKSLFSQVLHAGLREANHGYAAVLRALEQTADVLTTARMRPIEVLYMLGQISPMMGLLGTVYGIIFAFRVFVSMGGRASPALLAGGIGTALVATFWGLVVAIPALAGYSFLRNKVDQLTMEATLKAEELVLQFRPKPAAGPKPQIPPASAAQPAPRPPG